MNTVRRFVARLLTASAALAVSAAVMLFISPVYKAAGSVEVSTPAQFAAALADSTVNSITVKTREMTLTGSYNITRDLSISGSGGTITFEKGAMLTVPSGITLALSNAKFASTADYIADIGGTLSFGSDAFLCGPYGIRAEGGSSITSSGKIVNIGGDMLVAVLANCGGGNIRFSDVSFLQSSGSADAVVLESGNGNVMFNGTCQIIASSGRAIICRDAAKSPSVCFMADSNTIISAQSSTDGSSIAAAIYTGSSVTTDTRAKLSVTGRDYAVFASSFTAGDNSKTTLGCISEGSSGSSGSGSAALWVSGRVLLSKSAELTVGSSDAPRGNGIYAAKGIEFTEGSSYIMRGNSSQFCALSTPESLTLGDSATIVISGVQNGIIADQGVTAGKLCSFSLKDISSYGIKSAGTLPNNKLHFDEQNSIEIDAGYCALYTREALEIMKGSHISLKSYDKAPALWVDAEITSQGYVTIAGTDLTVSSGAGNGAARNAAVYCVGTVTFEQQTDALIENSGDFGLFATYGDINVRSSSSVRCSSGCSVYVLNGNVLLTDSGILKAEGLRDSAVRVENGSVDIGTGAGIDAQGTRFGAEILGESGGIRLSGASRFDIRSTGNRAVYIQNGSLDVSDVEKISAWKRAESGSNIPLWWDESLVKDMHSWEINDRLSREQKLYADHTALSPVGAQTYANGSAADHSGLSWLSSPWNADSYSRLGMYISRPVARPNRYIITAGRTFSWWLSGETYDGGEVVFRMVESRGEGEFVLNENGRFTYTAPSYTRGIQSFDFIVVSADGLESEPVTIELNVTASKPPVAYNATFYTKTGHDFIGQLSFLDYDGVIAAASVVTPPTHGSVILASDGRFKYTPQVGFTGIDEFTCIAEDNMGDKSNVSYVSIAVGTEDHLVAGNITLVSESSEIVSTRLYLLDKDDFAEKEDSDEGSDEDDAEASEETEVTEAETEAPPVEESTDAEPEAPVTYSYIIIDQPIYGILSFSSFDTIEYAPYDDINGADTFTYAVVDSMGNMSNTAHVTVATVPSQKPVANDSTFICAAWTTLRGRLAADDVDGRITGYTLTGEPENGRLTLDEKTGEFVYRAPFSPCGKVYFTYTATDDENLVSHEATVCIDVVTLLESLRASERLQSVGIAVICACVSMAVICAVLVSSSVRRKKEKELEREKRRLLGMFDNDDDDYYY